MKTVILCGGLGTRLAEETEKIPKPMIRIGDKPMLWHIMKIYSHFGFNDFFLALGYKSEMIKNYFLHYKELNSNLTVDLANNSVAFHQTDDADWRITMVDTGANTMTGGRVKCLKDFIGNQTFMMTYGDGVANINLDELLEFHKKHGKLITVTSVHPGSRYGELCINKDKVTSFKEKPQLNEGWINGGFFVVEPEFIEICRQRTYYGNELNWTNDWDEMEWRKYLYAYYRFTERVDQQIGRLLNALDENDLSDDTLVVLTSDHGEGVAAHQWVVKLMLYQEVVTVPFVIRWNGMIPENLVDRNHLVSGLDLLPTVCDYANIDLPAGLGGQSLRPLVENPSLPGRSYVVSELQPDPKHKEMEGRMIRTTRFKYIIFSHGQRPELLFDLEADPGETKNLAYQVAYRDIVLEHQALLLRVIKDTLDPFPMSKQMMP